MMRAAFPANLRRLSSRSMGLRARCFSTNDLDFETQTFDKQPYTVRTDPKILYSAFWGRFS